MNAVRLRLEIVATLCALGCAAPGPTDYTAGTGGGGTFGGGGNGRRDGGADAGPDGGTAAVGAPDAGVAIATISVGPGGVYPPSLVAQRGALITFANVDLLEHDLYSDPHPAHTDCPELNVGALFAGQSVTVTLGGGPQVCGFHDDTRLDETAFHGTIDIP